MDTVQSRGYVWKKNSALVPSWVAFAVVGLLEQHFARLVDYGFTAEMEEDLDGIARGDQESLPWLTRFYFGEPATRAKAGASDGAGLKQMVAERLGEIDARAVNTIAIGGLGSGIVVRVGKFGPYLQEGEGEKKANLPGDLAPDELTVERARELLEAPAAERADRELGTDPQGGLPVLVRAGRFGPYVQLGRAEELGPKAKPKTSSLLSGMVPEEVTLEDALRLLTLPRKLGRAPGTAEDVVADNGRYGPYVRRGADTRSLESEEQLFSVTLEEALDLLSKPKVRRTAQAGPPLAELGVDPVSGKPVVVKDGRFGPYVTDGTVNASLRRGDTIEALTLERAAELLAERRARAGAEGVGGARARSGAGRRGGRTASRAPARTAKRATGPTKAAAKSAIGATKAAAKSATGLTKAAAKSATGAAKAATRGAAGAAGSVGRGAASAGGNVDTSAAGAARTATGAKGAVGAANGASKVRPVSKAATKRQ
jgi:DNA topoisomerase-1